MAGLATRRSRKQFSRIVFFCDFSWPTPAGYKPAIRQNEILRYEGDFWEARGCGCYGVRGWGRRQKRQRAAAVQDGKRNTGRMGIQRATSSEPRDLGCYETEGAKKRRQVAAVQDAPRKRKCD